MDTISLKSIKWESIRSIFYSIAKEKRISRAEIAQKTGLSLMTVGKVADALLHVRAIEQLHESRSSAGRRAGLLSVSDYNFALIVNLTEQDVFVQAVDMHLEIIRELGHITLNEKTQESDFPRLIRMLSLFLERERSSSVCIGCAISVPDNYDLHTDRFKVENKPWLETIHIQTQLREAIPLPLFHVEYAAVAAAMAHIEEIPDYREQLILYLSAAEKNIRGAILYGGQILRGAHNQAGRFGMMQLAPWNSLDSTFHSDNSLRTNVRNFATELYNIIMLLDPNTIIIEREMYAEQDDFATQLSNILSEEYGIAADAMPHLIFSSGARRQLCRGLTHSLRESWLYQLSFGEELIYNK